MIKNEALYEKIVLCRDFFRNPKSCLEARKTIKKLFHEKKKTPLATRLNKKTFLNYAIVNPSSAVIAAHSLFQDKI